MNKIIGKLFIYTVVCASTLVAQDSLSVIGKFIDGHPWTMDFRISTNLTLTSFQGTAISLSKFISDYQKYRIGVSTSLYSRSDDQSGNNFNSDTLTYNSEEKSDINNNSIQLSFQYLTYATPNAHTSIYFGIGPLAGIGWSKQNQARENIYVNGALSQTNVDITSDNYSLGVLGSIGVEWFFTEHISLHAEYGISATHTWFNEKINSSSRNKYSYSSMIYSSKANTKRSSTYWSINGQSVLFGLSINF